MRCGPGPMLTIRAHHLLCMLGFRGLGYSPEFVENMRRVVAAYFSQPGQSVEVVAACDDICRACPHMRGGRCMSREGAEASVRAKDEAVLARLGVAAGAQVASQELAQRVAERFDPAALSDLCANCRWLPAGYCAEGLEERRKAR